MSENNRLLQATDGDFAAASQPGLSHLDRGAELAHKNAGLRQALGDITNVRQPGSTTKPTKPKLGERAFSRPRGILPSNNANEIIREEKHSQGSGAQVKAPVFPAIHGIVEESSPLKAIDRLLDEGVEVTGSATKKLRTRLSPSSRTSRSASIVSLGDTASAKALRALQDDQDQTSMTNTPMLTSIAPASEAPALSHLDHMDCHYSSVHATQPFSSLNNAHADPLNISQPSSACDLASIAAAGETRAFHPQLPAADDHAEMDVQSSTAHAIEIVSGHNSDTMTSETMSDCTGQRIRAVSDIPVHCVNEQAPSGSETITPTNAAAEAAGSRSLGTIATFTTTAVREGAADSEPISVTAVDSRNRPSDDQADIEGVRAVLYTLLPDIYSSLAQGEVKTAPHIDYFSTIQRGITAPNRAAVIDWMGEASAELHLRNQTLLLAVTIMDRFLSVVVVSSGKLQLLALCSLWIAAKFEEVHPPRIDMLLPLANHAYDRTHLIRVEPIVLSALGFGVACPTALEFLHCFSQSPCVPISGLGLTIAEFIIELCAQQPVYLQHRPSAIAASALFLARYILFSQGAQAQNLYRLQRLRDAYIGYHMALDVPLCTTLHPLFKSFLTIEPLAPHIVEVAIEATWPIDLVAVTRYKLSTLANCLNDVAAVLMYGMGYAAHKRNPYPSQPLACLTEDTQALAVLPPVLNFPPRDANSQFSCPEEPPTTAHCSLREVNVDALPMPDALLLPYYSDVIRDYLPADMQDADVNSRETFVSLPKEVRTLIVSHALSVDMRVPIPLNAFFGTGYAPTRSTFSRYASARSEHIAERFLPPFDLNYETIINQAARIEAIAFAETNNGPT